MACVLGCTFTIYYPGLFGTFILDDYHNVANNTYIAIKDFKFETLKQAALSHGSGLFRRPLSMLSFAANYYLTGQDPFYFKATNLAIHLINGIGVFLLTSLLLDVYRKRFESALSIRSIRWISAVVATAWLVHPFNLTSVLYIVQRMTSLSALFSIWGLIIFIWGRIKLYEGKSGAHLILLSLLVFTPLAALSKETGALLPILMFITEITLFNFDTKATSARRFLTGFYILVVALPIAAALAYAASHPDWLLYGYRIRSFTLPERLMTEARVLWFYIGQIILPNIAQMSLFHDDMVISRNVLQPASTLPALLGILVLVTVAVALRKKYPLIAFGLLFFLTGHLLESTVIPLEITYEHRNYFPMYSLLLIFFFYLLYPLRFHSTLPLRHVAVMLLVVLFGFGTFKRAGQWGNPFDLARAEVENHPDSLRSNAEMANILSTLISSDVKAMETYYFSARHYYENMVRIDDNDIRGLIGLILLNASRGKPADPSWTPALTYRLKHGHILIDTGNMLDGLVTCHVSGGCKLTNAELGGLFQAALQNPYLTPGMQAAVLSAMAYYQSNIANDTSAALATLRQTVATAPESIEYRLTLVRFLSALNHYSEAKDELDMIRKLDSLKLRSDQIAVEEKQLASQRNR